VETSELRNAGLKVTLPRVKILQTLQKSEDRHLSAEDVYRRLLESGDEISLATIYRVLTQFETAGLVQRHHFEGGQSIFELNEGDHHDHLVCVRCGAIEEFFDETIERRQVAVAERFGFDITDHALILYGVCSDCRSQTAAARSGRRVAG